MSDALGRPGASHGERPSTVSGMLIATHDGSFHADEVFAIAALSLLGEPVEVVRTRDRDSLARALCVADRRGRSG